MDTNAAAKELVKIAKSLTAGKRLSEVTGEDILNAYTAQFEEIKTDADRKHYAQQWQERVGRIQKAVEDGDEGAFRKEVSLSRSNYFGKVTKAIMDVMGISRAVNLGELFALMSQRS